MLFLCHSKQEFYNILREKGTEEQNLNVNNINSGKQKAKNLKSKVSPIKNKSSLLDEYEELEFGKEVLSPEEQRIRQKMLNEMIENMKKRPTNPEKK